MDAQTTADIAAAQALVTGLTQGLAPGSNAAFAVNAASILLSAYQQATASGADVTDAQLAALFSDDDLAKMQDLAAQKALTPKP